jgi:MoaA/NifB/PqqE/SkfB family radical SAM enzyme
MAVKKIIKKVPWLRLPAKFIFDELRERQAQEKITIFLKNELPYLKKCPANFEIGHEPTIRCNLECRMCYQRQTRSMREAELGTRDVLKIYQNIESHTDEIKIVGGEPLMRQDIIELVEFWSQRNVPVAIQTNLTLVTPMFVEKLKKFKNIKAFLTSLDGPEEIHNAVRGVPNAFERLVKSAKLIRQEMPETEISIFSMILVDNTLDGVYRVCDIAKSLGIGSVQFLFEQVNTPASVLDSQRALKENLGWNKDDYRINTQVRDNLFQKSDTLKIKSELQKLRRYGAKIGCFVNFVPYNFYKNLDVYFGQNEKRIFCTKLLSPQMRIVQTGDVVWCDILEHSFGNLTKSKLQDIWLSHDYQVFRNFLKNNSLPICRRCCKAVYIN